MSNTRKRFIRALHHAAHAATGEILGVTYGHIGLTRTDRRHLDPSVINRRIIANLDRPREHWPTIRDVTVVVMAGHVAEWIAEPDRPHDARPVTGDTLEAYGTIQTFRTDFEAAMLDVIGATFALVRTNWAAIEQIAAVLLRRRSMSAGDVQRLTRDKLISLRGLDEVHFNAN